MHKKRWGLNKGIALFCGAAAIGGALAVGRYGVTWPGGWTEEMKNVVFRIRLPRVGAAMLIGGALSLSGAVYQGIFRNPLVSPDILGVSSGASVGAAGAILLGLGPWGIEACAFLGGLAAVMISLALPRILKNSSAFMLVLAGILSGGFMNALLGGLKYVADTEMELAAIVYWTMGSLASCRPAQVALFGPWMLFSIFVLLALRWKINILSLGDSEAYSLGVHAAKMRLTLVIFATALTSFAVSLAGTIGWVGLVIPHLGRLLGGDDNRSALPVSVFLGGEFLLIADTLARNLAPSEIPLSILTGLIGTPLFVGLLFRRRLRIAE
ncbi:MAG: iron ABC transporter permease [Spirochaetaceae bacterium]|jgi:iron complex transport system permease protein|nr:iron ABC transporter permease [Spirochaetaceae bacterium]